ncbi:TetR/AcrR family transcriptional regulator [Providencia sp.]|uniref:TetR/AcrR family transcriptional regulator n=1 Tax=Providencia sp. TaxID=589 RepID=UPI000E883446|nr:TetR/AcrR family transcriptional regulator [Providencia sp.]HBO21997.1 TetR/AcrR family transcriptional regulator [Providencia sp.]
MKRKGRPRRYDSDIAINHITELFWRKGYTATSMDDLVLTTEMNKPSLYSAFGNKFAMYEKAIEHFSKIAGTRYSEALNKQNDNDDISQRLLRYFLVGIELYTGKHGQLGCMILSTASAEVDIPEVQQHLANVIKAQINQVALAITQALIDGELKENCDIDLTAQLITAILHSISLRARAGETEANLFAVAQGAIDMLIKPLTI